MQSTQADISAKVKTQYEVAARLLEQSGGIPALRRSEAPGILLAGCGDTYPYLATFWEPRRHRITAMLAPGGTARIMVYNSEARGWISPSGCAQSKRPAWAFWAFSTVMANLPSPLFLKSPPVSGFSYTETRDVAWAARRGLWSRYSPATSSAGACATCCRGRCTITWNRRSIQGADRFMITVMSDPNSSPFCGRRIGLPGAWKL